ncbi:hypothetical protein [Acetomicrobium sp.]|uniref:hypothetical protein n=1 Tax=Acetomicrobium sp. TaxID=1872099 RepID=UPI002FC84E98
MEAWDIATAINNGSIVLGVIMPWMLAGYDSMLRTRVEVRLIWEEAHGMYAYDNQRHEQRPIELGVIA